MAHSILLPPSPPLRLAQSLLLLLIFLFLLLLHAPPYPFLPNLRPLLSLLRSPLCLPTFSYLATSSFSPFSSSSFLYSASRLSPALFFFILPFFSSPYSPSPPRFPPSPPRPPPLLLLLRTPSRTLLSPLVIVFL